MDRGLEGYRRIEIRRPQYPQVLQWVDPEFQAIYINLDAAEDAGIICLLTNDEDDKEGEEEK